jgi:hypothetical protein
MLPVSYCDWMGEAFFIPSYSLNPQNKLKLHSLQVPSTHNEIRIIYTFQQTISNINKLR